MAKLSLLALVSALLVATVTATILNQISCQQAVTTIMPCLEYLKGRPEKPDVPCCVGVQKLNTECELRPDRVKICKCLKDATLKFGIDPDRIRTLPTLCGVFLPFEIVQSFDCNKIRH